MEMAIKQAVGKLRMDISLGEFVAGLLSGAALPAAVRIDHAVAVGALPLHHRDPFDRTLIAQAQIDDLTLVTADPRILQYDVAAIDARK